MARLGQLLRSATNPLEPYCPDADEFIWIDCDPQAGREQAGRRPALVLSPLKYNERARLCVLCPITTQVKGYPFEVAIPEGLPVSGVVIADQVKSLSWDQRNSVFAAKAPAGLSDRVKEYIKRVLGLS